MMPGAAYAVADHEPLREGAVIVAAMGIDGEESVARAHEQDILIADVTKQLSVDEIA